MSAVVDHNHQPSQEQDQDILDDSTPIMVVIIERQQCWIGRTIDYNVGLTLLAIMSEDPASWPDVAKYWPRYRTAVVGDELPVQQWTTCDEATAWEALDGHGNWLVFDLQDKRIITGHENQEFEWDMHLGMPADIPSANSPQMPSQPADTQPADTQPANTQPADTQPRAAQRHCCQLLPVHLPPWWELHQKLNAADVSRRRAAGFNTRRADRKLLYGRPLIEDVAGRIVEIALAGRMPDGKAAQSVGTDSRQASSGAIDRAVLQAWYELTTEVHREWLMTARDDLDGGRPRDMLHGAHAWCDAVIEGQCRRFERGAAMVAAPEDVEDYAHAPLGSQEMIVYFDLCREVIQAGWAWVASQTELTRESISPLIVYLQEVRDEWLKLPFEGGAPPRFIIACSRRRVPRAAGVTIEGMHECEATEHAGDCDCPICNLLDSGMLGTCYTSMDGHHLELDDEFAFSMFEKFEDWQEQSSEWHEILDAAEDSLPQANANAAALGNTAFGNTAFGNTAFGNTAFGNTAFGNAAFGNAAFGNTACGNTAFGNADLDNALRPGILPLAEFASAWSGRLSDETLPGDRRGYLKLSFRLAEVIGDLESCGAPRKYIAGLNKAFRAYFESSPATAGAMRTAFKEKLEEVGGQFPWLLPKLCDLQSQVDELQRRLSSC